MSDRIRERMSALGIALPQGSTAKGEYVNAVTVGELVFVAGHGPLSDGKPVFQGRVGADLDVERGKEAARLTMLNCLATLDAHLGGLDAITRIVKVFGMVNAAPDFERHPEVLDGASRLLIDVFGDRGVHARSAVGMGTLPFGIPVEIEMIVQVSRAR